MPASKRRVSWLAVTIEHVGGYCSQRFAKLGRRQIVERGPRRRRVFVTARAGLLKSIGSFDSLEKFVTTYALIACLAHHSLDHLARRFIARNQINQRQRHFAAEEINAGALAQLVVRRSEVEKIVG